MDISAQQFSTGPQIFTAKVMHRRLFPKENKFVYGIYYLALPLPAPKIPGFLVKFDPNDLGYQNGQDPKEFANKILNDYGLLEKTQNIMLVTMPKVLGYVFNPVSFYLCLNNEQKIIAVISEVHNTFGERHTYLCAHPDHRNINACDWLEAEKTFHVSPFLERSGSYRFRFSLKENNLGIWIDYFDKQKNKQLLTSLIGTLQPLNKSSLRKAFWSHPLVTLQAIILIHWQAVKLVCKSIRYIKKPKQEERILGTTLNLQEHKKNDKLK